VVAVGGRVQSLSEADCGRVVAGVSRALGKLVWLRHRAYGDVLRSPLSLLELALERLDLSQQHQNRFAHPTALGVGGCAQRLGPCSQFVFLDVIHPPIFAETTGRAADMASTPAVYLYETGEALSGLRRPGNAGANIAPDHVAVLSRAVEQLPQDRPHEILVRCDSGGATHDFLDVVGEMGFRFSVGYKLTEGVRRAILATPEPAWTVRVTLVDYHALVQCQVTRVNVGP
jgi:Transposase DDE domain group 1